MKPPIAHEYRLNFRNVTDSSQTSPACGLDRDTAFAVKADLEAQGLMVSLIHSETLPESESYHLEITNAAGAMPQKKIMSPALQTEVVQVPEAIDVTKLAEVARRFDAARSYGLNVSEFMPRDAVKDEP